MKLLYITSRAPFGSGETFVISEIEEVVRQGHDVVVVPMNPVGTVVHAASRALLPRCMVQPILSFSILGAALREIIRAPRRCLAAFLGVIAPNPRHLLTNAAAFPKALWLAERVRTLGVEHIHAHWATTTASMAMACSTVARVPWSFTGHRYDIHDNNLFRRKVERAAFVRLISSSGVDMAVRRCGITREHVLLLHMGVEVPDAVARVSSKHHPFRLLCPARLSRVKGHQYLLRAIANLRCSVEVWLAGDGEEQEAIRAMIKELGLANVMMLGNVANEELQRLYREREIDAVVLPSVDLGNNLHEGIPTALMEAMACGIPVISTRTGGIPELLEGAGLLVGDKDPEALTLAIESLVHNDEIRDSMGQAGRERITAHFCRRRVTERLLEMIVRATAGGRVEHAALGGGA